MTWVHRAIAAIFAISVLAGIGLYLAQRYIILFK